MAEDVELQSLVKVSVKLLDPNIEPILVTAVSENGLVCAEQVHRKMCSFLGLHKSSWQYFTLLEKGERPIRRYHNGDLIKANGADLYLCKWCFQTSLETDLIHNNPVAAHLIFLQARQDVQSGKLSLQKEDKEILENCIEPDLDFENQYVQICQKQPDYWSLYIPQCCLLQSVSTSFGLLKTNSMFDVVVSKFGVKLLAEVCIIFTWFELSRWSLNKEKATITLTYAPAACNQTDIVLKTEQAEFFLAGILEFVKLLQLEEKLQLSFHADMITTTQDGMIVTWENGLHDIGRAESARQIL